GDAEADVSASGEVPVPGTGLTLPAQLTGSVEIDVESYVHIFALTHVFEKKVLGGNAGLAVMVPYVNADLDVSGDGVLTLTGPGGMISFDIPVSGESDTSDNGIGDMSFTGLLGWHRERLHYLAILNVYAPTGEYDEDQALNVGKNHWAIEPMGAVTYLNEKTGLELSGAAGITFNMENKDTEYTSGEEFHLDLAAIQHFSEYFYLGLVGYVYHQLSGDSGDGASDDFKGRVYAWGPVIGGAIPLGEKRNLFVNARYYDEFDAKNRLEGNAFYLTGVVNF
ncbi:MAG: transporter, partial [Nitrospiraceae bacterium]